MEEYDISYDSGRNARGTMRYNPVAVKYKVILHTKYLPAEEVIEFFSILKNLKQYNVYFYNPYRGGYTTANCYRGDRKITMKWNITNRGILFNPFDISLIEL